MVCSSSACGDTSTGADRPHTAALLLMTLAALLLKTCIAASCVVVYTSNQAVVVRSGPPRPWWAVAVRARPSRPWCAVGARPGPPRPWCAVLVPTAPQLPAPDGQLDAYYQELQPINGYRCLFCLEHVYSIRRRVRSGRIHQRVAILGEGGDKICPPQQHVRCSSGHNLHSSQ